MADIRGKSGTPKEGREASDDMIGKLLDYAGPPPRAPEDFLAEVKRQAQPIWQAKVAAHARARRQRRSRWLAAAAVLILGVGALLWQRVAPVTSDGPSGVVATVESAVDASRIAADASRIAADASRIAADSGAMATGDSLENGTVIHTAATGRVALRLAGGASLRVDADTRVALASASALVLHRGAVYIDSGPGIDAGLEVQTPFGVARDIGTQFEVRLAEEALQIRVREGQVELETASEIHAITAGSAIAVNADGHVEFEAVQIHGPAWRWVLDTAPPFDADGHTLGELLDWVARETGWHLHFADSALEIEVRAITVRSSIAGLTPDQAPGLVLPSAGLSYRLVDGTLFIESP